MAGRDALLPLLETVPDRRFRDELRPDTKPDADATKPLPYPKIEDAIKADAPAKLMLLRIMCKGVSGDAIWARASYLGKTNVVSALLASSTPEERVKHIIGIHAAWEDPLPLLRRLFDAYSAELATWRDPWGNGFFWYLYFREPVSRPVIEALPDTLTATFTPKKVMKFQLFR